ncbi:MAG: hypothetical protein OHK0046_42010 [Anaerolineae bacterium]
MTVLTAETLLAGSNLTFEVKIPAELMHDSAPDGARVILRPLNVSDLQRISKAAGSNDNLTSILMIQYALVEPPLKSEQVAQLAAGLARFLIERITEISGMSIPRNALEELVQAPLARACFTLAKEFGWTPEEVSGMTIGQILLYLEMSQQQRAGATL